MSPTDLPQVPSEHAGTIIGENWPQTSETGTVSSVIELYRRAAESVGTADTAGTMEALIEANATGKTPTDLLEHFTAEQRKAFDRSLQQLNMGQGASAMAQDILNTKVQLNGTVVSFETALEQLMAAAAAAPQTPKTQAEFQKRYKELVDEAKQQADALGKNHRSTQDALVSSVQRGVTPEIPDTMALTDPANPTVPGMPDGALGSVLQNVMGQMMKPGNLPMPNLQGASQAMAPLAQSAQQAIGQLMSSLGGASAGEDPLAVLSKASGVGGQESTLSDPADAGSVGAGGAGAAAGNGGASRPGAAAEGTGKGTDGEARTTLAAESPETGKPSLSTAAVENASAATAPAAPAVTEAPASAVPATKLSSGDAVTSSETVSSARTHTSSGDVIVGSAPLSSGGAAAATAGTGTMMGGAPMMPMMPPMMPPMAAGASPAAAPATTPSGDRSGGSEKAHTTYKPDRPEVPVELTDFGSELRGLAHATDIELVASSILAALVRTHDRVGVTTEVAVGVSPTSAVFVTSDGLGFLRPGIRAAGHLTPLITVVPSDFIARWLGCDQPWRPLLEAAALNLVGPFETVVTTDAGASAFGVLALNPEQIAAVNIAAGSKDRWHFDAVDAEDVTPAAAYLESVWGRPLDPAMDLESIAVRARWSGDAGPGNYPQRWVRFLLATAAADMAAGDVDDARYALRSALRVPEPPQRQEGW